MAKLNGKNILFSPIIPTSLIEENARLKNDINNINAAFESKGVEVGETPSSEYGGLIDEAADIFVYNTFKGKTSFAEFFAGCTTLTEIPPLDTSAATYFGWMFRNCAGLVNIPELDTSKGKNFSGMFHNCDNLSAIPQLNTPNGTNFDYMFGMCKKLVSISSIDISKATKVTDMFNNCRQLKNITFNGSIKISISFEHSPYLSAESVQSIIDALYDYTGGTACDITFANKTTLTEEQINAITNKNWNLYYF